MSSKIPVTTTLPRLPNHTEHSSPVRPAFQTARLTVRPWTASDFTHLREWRSQPEVMYWSAQGVPDKDDEQSRRILDRQLAALNYSFIITLTATQDDDAGAVVLGCGGCSVRKGMLGWPEIGYTFKRQHWGQGYATEFVEGFLKFWWQLDRESITGLEVDASTIFQDGAEATLQDTGTDAERIVDECLVAVAVGDHVASIKVMEKCCMLCVKEWEEPDLRDTSVIIKLRAYAAKRPPMECSSVQ